MSSSSTYFNNSDDPILNPFYYAQDVDGYLEEQDKQFRSEQQQTSEKCIKQKKLAIKKLKRLDHLTSFAKKNVNKGRHIIKINILDVSEKNELIDTANVQYVVEENFDNILDEAKYLVEKIVKKIGQPNL